MAVAVTSFLRVSSRSMHAVWTVGSGGPYTIRVGGVAKFITTALEADISIAESEFPVVEIVDGSEVATQAFPGTFTLGWESVDNTAHYKVEELVSAVWTLRQRVKETGKGYYSWTSRFLEDDTVHQFRVTPVGLNGVTGIMSEFTRRMRRHPDPPDASYAYDPPPGTSKVTVTIA